MATEKANISKGGRRLSGIWFIPILALALGAYMVAHNIMTEGPDIEIKFDTASGLEAGKTKIKYRNVTIGVVEEIRLDDAFDSVVATAKLDRQVEPLLREDTRFWVVTARVSAGNVSGLETLLSGAYIELSPGSSELEGRRFVALAQPPLTPTGAPGLRLKLISSRSTSLSTGDRVIYQGHEVGRVEKAEFDPKALVSRYVIFIDAPYHELISTSTRFWDVGGISLNAGADGLNLEIGSLDTILLGGAAFGVPKGMAIGEPVDHNTEFQLYSSQEETQADPYNYGLELVVMFSQSVKGLHPGAPVEYRGITIGKVERIMLKESTEKLISEGERATGEPIPILIHVEPGRLGLPDTADSIQLVMNNLKDGVQNGMRASIETNNLLTGSKLIALDYYPSEAPRVAGTFLEYTTLPTLETGLNQLEQKINAILDQIAGLPLDDTVAGLNTAVATLNETLAGMNGLIESQGIQQLPAELNKTLADIQRTVEGLGPESDMYQSISSSLLRLNHTLGNIETMTNTLATQPNAIVLPSKATPDPVPEARK